MTKQFKYFQSIVNYRVEVKPDNTLGTPEIQEKWTTVRGAPKYKKPKPKPKKQVIKENSSMTQGKVTY